MALLSFGNRAQQPNKLGSIQVPTSERGVAVPYAAGTLKLPIKLLDYVDFVADKQDVGGKGGGNYNYEYYAAVDLMICRGPIDGVGNIYDGGGSSSLLVAVETYTISGSSPHYETQYNGSSFYFDQGVTRAVTFSVSANDYGSDGLLVISGTQNDPMEKVSGTSPTVAGTYSADSHGNYYFAPADDGITVTITYNYTTADTSVTTNRSPLNQYALTVIDGSRPGTQWGYMLSSHPERALYYPGVARVVSESMDLGTTGTTPVLSPEVINARGLAFGGGVADCDPSTIIADILGEPIDGCDWPYLGDMTQYSNFCVANRLFMSVGYDSQSKATDIIREITDLTNSEPVWSGSTLKIIPYGDTTAVAYGRTFSPQNTPIYEIDEDEFLCGDGEESLPFDWPDLGDNFNRIEFEYLRRDDSYNTDILREQDEASILMNGLLPKRTVTAHHFCETDYASIAMNMMLKRKAVPLRTFRGKLPWYFELLEPMDVVLVNMTTGALSQIPLRVISANEQDDESISVEFQDFVYGVANGVLYPKQGVSGNGPGSNDQPGDTTLLASFQPPSRVADSPYELWLALSGGPSWGGCRAWLSLDGTTFSDIGLQYGKARAGTLTAPLAANADPDTTDTASVSVSGTLATVSATDNDSYATLSLLGTELISYETATITGSTSSANAYSLTTLHRGIFSTPVEAHGAGEAFVRLDTQVFRYTYDPSLTGRTVFLKFTSRNLYGEQEQALSDVSAVAVVLGGTIGTTMQVGSYTNSGGSSATVDVYLPGGASGASGTAALSNGASVTLPPQTWASESLATTYYVNFNTVTSAYVLYTDRNAWLADQASGMIAIGYTTTPASGASSLLPSTYTDTGSYPTQTPTGAWTGSSPAVVSGSAGSMLIESSRPVYSRSEAGVFTVSGFAGTTTSAMMLSITGVFSAAVDGSGSNYGALSVTLDGSTWTTLASFTSNTASASYTAAIPSGTNLANVRVQATCHSAATTATVVGDDNEAGCSLSLSAIHIA